MVGALGPAHVLHGDVGNNLMHGIKQLVARLLSTAGVATVDPQTAEFLFDGRSHVTEEGTGRRSVMTHCGHAPHVMGAHGVTTDRGHGRHRVELIGGGHATVKLVRHAGVHVHGSQPVVHLMGVVLGQSREQDVTTSAHWCRREHVVLRRRLVVLGRLGHFHVPPQQEIPRCIRRVLVRVLVHVGVATEVGRRRRRRVGVGTERVDGGFADGSAAGSALVVNVVQLVVLCCTEIEPVVEVLVVVVYGGHVRCTHQERGLVPLVEPVIHH